LDANRPRAQTGNRMIVLAHSLGAHLMMVGLEQTLLDSIRGHQANDILEHRWAI
jgi:esterase/lipase superfamily enzyme